MQEIVATLLLQVVENFEKTVTNLLTFTVRRAERAGKPRKKEKKNGEKN
jgi:hypothetical protein